MAQLGLAEADLVSYEEGVAGHEGMLANAAGDLIIKPCTQTEVDFYQACIARSIPLLPYLPTFMGTLHLSHIDRAQPLTEHVPNLTNTDGQEGASVSARVGPATASSPVIPLRGHKLDTDQAIVLENVAAGFVKPNIMDIKLGSRLWADDAPVEKRQRLDEVASRTTSGSLGFRIAGMRIWDPGRQDVDIYGKTYGRSLSSETVVDAFKKFFGSTNEDTTAVLDLFHRGIEAIKEALESMESRIYSSSILMVYEGDAMALRRALDAAQEGLTNSTDDGADDGDESDEADQGPKICRLVLIDFAHATLTPGQGHDRNMVLGVDNVLKAIEKLG